MPSPQHPTRSHRGRHLPPGTCPHGVGNTRPQTACRSFALPLWELLRQRRLAFLRHPGSQPLPVDRTPHPPMGRLTNGNTVRTRLFTLPGRIVNHGRKLILRLPTRWPWADTYTPPSPASAPSPNSAEPAHTQPNKPTETSPTGSTRPKAPYPTEHPQQTGPTPTEPHPPPQIHPPPLPTTQKRLHHSHSDTPIGGFRFMAGGPAAVPDRSRPEIWGIDR